MQSVPATALAEGLANESCTVAFGVPGGGPNLDVVGAFADRGIDFVLAHTETAACIMASTWGWLSDAVSAVVVTRGPGAASAVNGAAQATLDRQPLVLVTDTVPQNTRNRIPHQRIDQQALFAPVCKASAIAGSQTSVADIEAAASLAKAWPSGCVHLDYDASHPGSRVAELPAPPSPAVSASPTEASDAARLRAHDLIANAKRPVVIVGVGATATAVAVRSALESFGAPTLATYQGIGILPTEDGLAAGLFTNGASERPLLDQADLIVMVGIDMVEPIPAPWKYEAPVVSLASVATPDPYIEGVVEVVGDLAVLATELLTPAHQWSATVGQDHNTVTRDALAAGAPSDVFGPVTLTKTLRDLVPTDATVTVDAGAHFLAIMPFWNASRPRQLLISNGLATMGYAVPAAIGAALARQGEPVIALTGDGGLGMCLAELETIGRRQLPVTIVVFNDAMLSLIKIKQQAHHGDERAVQYSPTDFAAVANGMGVAAEVVEDPAELRAALAQHDYRSPFLVDARIDPTSYRHLISVTRG